MCYLWIDWSRRLIEALVQCGTMAQGTSADTERHRETERGGGSCVATLYSLGLADSLVAVHTPCNPSVQQFPFIRLFRSQLTEVFGPRRPLYHFPNANL